MATITRALISVSDKTGIVAFAKNLADLGVEILSTGGTAKLLSDEGVRVIEVSDYTGLPEMLDGRVKTLHPKIHGGILGRRDSPQHTSVMKEFDIQNIDLVCVNLYPFAATIAKDNCSLAEAIENIDIGGPAMVRSAAKNWAHVAILTDYADYPAILTEMVNNKNSLSEKTRFNLARKAFTHTAGYDGAISNYLTSIDDKKLDNIPECGLFPQTLNLQFVKAQDMRYGENPHQQAAFYQEHHPVSGSFAHYTQFQGKALSYNNIADADAAWEMVKSFSEAACVIIKHANPCGVATATDTLTAYKQAFASDPVSAFGGIIAFNQTIDAPSAQTIRDNQFFEVLIAPTYTDEALHILSQKNNVRVLSIPLPQKHEPYFEFKRIGGGLLVQTPDIDQLTRQDMSVVSQRAPSEQEWADLLFAWKVVKHVKSNAVVFCKNGQTCGIGAGQMSRVDATLLATRKAADANLSLAHAVAASDAFFPFADGVEVIARQGIKAIIHPGGSIKDKEIVAAADQHGIAMVLTGIRHFKH